MTCYFRADFKGAINHGETPSSCNDEMGVRMDGQVAWINPNDRRNRGTSMATTDLNLSGFSRPDGYGS